MAEKSNDNISFSVKELGKLDPYVKSEVLRVAIQEVKGDLKNISRKNILDILGLLKNTSGTKKVRLPQELLVSRVYDKLVIRRQAKSPLKKPKIVRLEMNKETRFGKWRLFLGKQDLKNKNKQKNLVFLDIKKTPTLLVRCRKSGDRMNIGTGTKKLQDIFVDGKIPKEERENYPVIVNENDEIVWIPEIRANPAYTKKSGKTLVIKAFKEKT